jgi:hypothetical protein
LWGVGLAVGDDHLDDDLKLDDGFDDDLDRVEW